MTSATLVRSVATRIAAALGIAGLLAASVLSGCADPPEPPPLPVGTSEQDQDELRAAYWRAVLDRHPDLPDLLRAVAAARGQAGGDASDREDSPPSGGSGGVGDGLPPSAPIRIVVTDLDGRSLGALGEYLDSVRDGKGPTPSARRPDRSGQRAFRLEIVETGTGAATIVEADTLEIAFHSTADAQLDQRIHLHLLGSNSARGPPNDLIVIGSRSTVHVRNPKQQNQAIAIQLIEGPRGSVGTATLHAFPNASRGVVPLETLVKSGGGARPPPVRVLLAGGLDEMNFHRVGRAVQRITTIDVNTRSRLEDPEFIRQLDAAIKRGESAKVAERARAAEAAANARAAARQRAAVEAARAEKARIAQAWRDKSLYGHVDVDGRAVAVYDLGPEFAPKRYVIGESRYALLSNGVF